MTLFKLRTQLWHCATVVLKSPLHIFYFVSGFIPRNRRNWVFGSWNGQQYRGNSKYLFDYVRENHPAIDAAWITKDRALFDDLQSRGIKVYLGFSVRGMWATLRARYLFVTHGVCDVNEYASRNATLINLSHSTYPIKNMRAGHASLVKRLYATLLQPYGLLVKPTFAIAASAYTVDSVRHKYNIPVDRVVDTGVPKTDHLLSLLRQPHAIPQGVDQRLLPGNRKLILCLPTWRGDRQFSIFDFGFDAETLENLLEKIDGAIAFNFHPFTADQQRIPDFSRYERIEAFQYSGNETDRLLGRADVLITDYSSLFADFLLYDRPFIFAKFDHQEYADERGLYVDYDRDLPGAKADTWQDIHRHLEDMLLHSRDEYQQQRRALRALIYPSPDGKCCERLANFALGLDD